jgi:hypothetical protein
MNISNGVGKALQSLRVIDLEDLIDLDSVPSIYSRGDVIGVNATNPHDVQYR